MAVPVLDHDDGGVHEHSDGEREAAQGHDVRGDVEVIHRDKGREHGDGQRQDGNEGRAEVKQEDDNDQADDDRLLQQVALQRVDGGMDQAGAVVTGDDLDAGRKRRLISVSLAFTPSMTVSAFMPSRMTMMPPTVSPSPCQSAAPWRSRVQKPRSLRRGS